MSYGDYFICYLSAAIIILAITIITIPRIINQASFDIFDLVIISSFAFMAGRLYQLFFVKTSDF